MVKKIIIKNTKVKAKNEKGTEEIKEKITTTVECRYYICSIFTNIYKFKYATRNHWSIENKIHWHLDFTFCQDANTTTNKNALLNIEIIYKFILAILNRVKPKYNRSIREIRKHLNNDFMNFCLNYFAI